jgi:membrane-associated phospholipid phosphatase
MLFAGLLVLRPAISPVPYISLVAVLGFCTWQWLPRTDFRTFCVYILGFSLFNGLRTVADETGIAWQFSYVIIADELLFFGAVPTVRLQDHLYEAGRMTVLEWACVGVYASYFTAHFILGAIIWMKKRELLSTYVTVVVFTLSLGLTVYFLVPTAPPWLAANAGDLPDVARISALANSEVWADAYERGSYVAGANDVGAMPSLHTALTAVVAMACWRMNRVLGILGWFYVGAMGFSLMYLGEHYLIDVLAGVAVAALTWRLVTRRIQVSNQRSDPFHTE